MKFTAVWRILAIGSVLAPGCVWGHGDVLRDLRASWETAMVRGDAVAAAAIFDANAVQLRPGRPTSRGRAAIAAKYREDLTQARVDAVKMTASRTEVTGSSALEHGTFRIRWVDRSDASKSADLHGRYLLAARRIDGKWRLTMEMHTLESEVPEEQLR